MAEQARALQAYRPPSALSRRHLTTTQAGRVCGVSCRTICKWCNRNFLKHHVLPGSGGYRRILVEDLKAFCEAHQIQPDWEAL